MEEQNPPLLGTTSKVVLISLKDERPNLFLIQTLFHQCGGLSQRPALISMESLKLSRVSGLATKWDAHSAAKAPVPDFPGVNLQQMALQLTRLERGWPVLAPWLGWLLFLA